jgi:hypothetical protein
VFDDLRIPRLKGLLYQQFGMLTGGGCHRRCGSMKDTHAGTSDLQCYVRPEMKPYVIVQ